MTLREWVQSQGRGAITRLHRQTGVTRRILTEVALDRRRLDSYSVADRIVQHAPGVTHHELCTWPQEPGGES